MPSTHIQQHLPFFVPQLMELVLDVESYRDFIPIISAIRVMGRRKVFDNGGQSFDADMRVAYKFLSENVRCHVQSYPVDGSSPGYIRARKSGSGGSIKVLENDWLFCPLSDGSTFLDFYVDVTLKAAPLNFLASQKFSEISQRVMNMFIGRAGDIYTPITPSRDLSREIEDIKTKLNHDRAAILHSCVS